MRGKFKSLTMVNWNGFFARTFDLDQLESASVLEQHLQSLAHEADSEPRNTVVVCGGKPARH